MSHQKEPDPRKDKPASSGAGQINVRETAGGEKPVRRTFPGPRGAKATLRVAVERNAHAELIAHAKQSLDAEVCGVLAGQVCEDDEGIFVHVEAVIRGAAATEGSTHVTFTQATWNAIYKILERDHPKLKIVGWYHTHPGWTIFLSQWDLFIHQNFFKQPWQIALVIDPTLDRAGFFVWNGGQVDHPDAPVAPFRLAELEGWKDILRPRVRIKLTDAPVKVSR